MKRIFLDTSPFIYFIENHEKYADALERIFSGIASGNYRGITSVITLHEVMVKPIRERMTKLMKAYQEILQNSENLEIVSITPEIAELSAEIRAKYDLRTPDALQFASALHHSADEFFTNDRALEKAGKLLKVVILDDVVKKS